MIYLVETVWNINCAQFDEVMGSICRDVRAGKYLLRNHHWVFRIILRAKFQETGGKIIVVHFTVNVMECIGDPAQYEAEIQWTASLHWR